ERDGRPVGLPALAGAGVERRGERELAPREHAIRRELEHVPALFLRETPEGAEELAPRAARDVTRVDEALPLGLPVRLSGLAVEGVQPVLDDESGALLPDAYALPVVLGPPAERHAPAVRLVDPCLERHDRRAPLGVHLPGDEELVLPDPGPVAAR